MASNNNDLHEAKAFFHTGKSTSSDGPIPRPPKASKQGRQNLKKAITTFAT